ncbi:hypothetical protein Vafri_17343 [Volvox africanus]|uniref:inositol-pentakisphosphate 2-kinase n=1 Tax=Volvox africanus TaxID=51714 RepID=A0A8J4F7C2_9CHLO|nr:hypothetical protein Vafri_17343 [Volvox africanus]
MKCDWQLKGEGAANMVFAYCGDDPTLRGHVLRVRKSSAHTASAVDRALWSSVLGAISGIQLELEYVSALMAPMLGHEYVFPGVPVPIPGELHAAMGSESVSETNAAAASSSSSSSNLPAVILPDHTTFQSKVALGYKGVGPTVCLEIKPKWGLDPRRARRSENKLTNLRGDDSGGDKLQSAPKPASAGSSESVITAGQPEGLLTGPDTCALEVYPAGDGDASSPCRLRQSNEDAEASRALGLRMLDGESFLNGNNSLDFRQHFPRFMLHMLYKHVKHGVPISLYNPLDLFSEELERMEAALRALIRSPSNNLVVFRDGILIYGATHVKARKGGDEGHQKHEGTKVAVLEGLAVNLQGFFEVDTVQCHQGDNESNLVAVNAAISNQPVTDATALTASVVETASTGGATATATVAVAIEMGLGLPGVAAVTAMAAAAATGSCTLHTSEDANGGAGSASASTSTSASAGCIAAANGIGCPGGGAFILSGAASASLPASVPAPTPTSFGTSCAGTAVPDTDTERQPSSARPSCKPEPLMGALDSLARLTALALHKEGLMSRLQQVQALDGVGPEGALRLYDQLVQELRAAEALIAGTNQMPDSGSGSSGGGGDTGGGTGGDTGCGTGCGTGNVTAAPSAETLAALRHYLMSATAKDCGIMVTLQRAVAVEAKSVEYSCNDESVNGITNRNEPKLSGQQPPQTPLQTETVIYNSDGSSSSHVAIQEGHLHHHHHHHHHHQLMLLSKQQQPCVRVLVDPQSGATYMYKVALVDLDVKAASKIPKHVELERSLVSCAEDNRELLWALAQQTGWVLDSS